VLVRRRVEDNVRAVLLEDRGCTLTALDVGEDRHRVREPEIVGERPRHRDERSLSLIDEDETADAAPHQLRTELPADRASGAGDEDGRAGEVGAEAFDIDVHDRPAEQRDDVAVRRMTVQCGLSHRG
jgi:hypothetical protein